MERRTRAIGGGDEQELMPARGRLDTRAGDSGAVQQTEPAPMLVVTERDAVELPVGQLAPFREDHADRLEHRASVGFCRFRRGALHWCPT